MHVFLRLENKNEMICKITWVFLAVFFFFLKQNCRGKAAQSEKRIFLQSHSFDLASS